MLLDSIFKKRKVCGVDLSASAGRVCVVGMWERGRIFFSKGEEIPESCDLACAIPPRCSLIRRLESPFSSPSKTQRVLPSLLDVQMPFSLEECNVAFTHLQKKTDGKMTAIASVARTADLVKFLDEQKAAGLDPVHVDVEGVALWEGSLEELPLPENGSRVAVLKVEPDGTTLVLGHDGLLVAAHALSDLAPVRVRRLLIAAFGIPCVIDWRLCGSGCRDSACDEMLASLGKEWVGNTFIHEEPEAFLARAITRRAAECGVNSVNLRQGVLKHDSLVSVEDKSVKALAGLLLASGLLLGSLSFGLNGLLERRMESQDRDFLLRASELAGPALGDATGLYAIPVIERIVAKRIVAAQPFLAPFQTSPQTILRELALHAAESEILLEKATVSSGEITIEGTASSWSSPERLEKWLKARGLSVTLDREESLASEAVRYTVVAKGRGVWQ